MVVIIRLLSAGRLVKVERVLWRPLRPMMMLMMNLNIRSTRSVTHTSATPHANAIVVVACIVVWWVGKLGELLLALLRGGLVGWVGSLLAGWQVGWLAA